MVVFYIAHTATMLERTAEAAGATKQVFNFADTLLFCKADLHIPEYAAVHQLLENIVLDVID